MESGLCQQRAKLRGTWGGDTESSLGSEQRLPHWHCVLEGYIYLQQARGLIHCGCPYCLISFYSLAFDLYSWSYFLDHRSLWLNLAVPECTVWTRLALNLRDPPASASRVPGLKLCTTTAGHRTQFNMSHQATFHYLYCCLSNCWVTFPGKI